GLPAAVGHVLQVVRVGQMIDAGQYAAKRLAGGGDAAGGNGAEANTVITSLSSHEHVTVSFAARPVKSERDLERGIHCLGARIGEEHVIETGGRELRD